MTVLIICEKPQQARNMQDAVGSNPLYKILPAQGHLYRLQLPEEYNPEWKEWGTDILAPMANLYPLVEAPDQGRGPRITAIRQALRSAEKVIIATDCDREGQAIGEDIIREMRYKGPVLRAMFQNEDPETMRDAVKTAKPNNEYANLYGAAVARRQADQIFNLSMTRIASLCLKPEGWSKAVGVGRVKTPTFGIVCAREIEIQNFVPVDYYVLSAMLKSDAHSFKLTHKTTGDTKILSREKADALAQTVRLWNGPIRVKTEQKSQSPERAMDLPTLQKRASKWGWKPTKTLEIAQALYEKHKISSYPRAETRYLNEIMIKDAQPILDALHKIYPISQQWSQPRIRTGKSGLFSDAGVGNASHHAIIPNVKMLDQLPSIYKNLDADEQRLFDLIAKTYLAAIAPDYEYDQKSITVEITHENKQEILGTTGSTPLKLGWKALFQDDKADIENDEDSEDNGKLPPVADGALASVSSTNIDSKKTKPPSRFTLGDLVDEMQNAWRYVDDPAMKERLKEAKGIGTPATRDTIIDSLLAQKWIEETKHGKTNYVQPTPEGLKIYHTLKQNAHWLVDPGFTAQMELRLDAILDGRLTSDRVIGAIVDVAHKIRDKIVEIAPPKLREISIVPSEAQIKLVERVAKDKALELPENYKIDRAACSAFLSEHKPDGKPKSSKGNATGTTPSAKQIEFAEKIASRKKKKIPASTLKDSRKLSEWIDKNNK